MIRGELSVRLDGSTTDRIVIERNLSGLKFSKSAPGGHASASCRLALPRNLFPDLGPANRMYVYDTRTGRTVWEGYTNNPSAETSDEGGESFDLTALGGKVLASDVSQPLVYLDNAGCLTSEAWQKYTHNAPGGTAEITSAPDAADDSEAAMLLQFPSGQVVTTGSIIYMRYNRMRDAGMKVSRFGRVVVGGMVDANYINRAVAWGGGTSEIVAALSKNMNLSVSSNSAQVVTDFDNGRDSVGFRIERTAGGATNVANDTTWFSLTDVYVKAMFLTKLGVEKTSSGSYSAAGTVLASEIVEDLLGRVLNRFDAANATVETTTATIDQLAYVDGVTPEKVFDDLALYEPDFLWEVLESNAAGLHRFNFRAWPTSPRYMIDPREHVEQPGSDVDLCNRIVVYWTDAKGAKQATIRTSTVPALGTRIRDAEDVTLPDGLGSLANAQRIGDQILASKASAPKAARATITRPLVDRLTGNLVQPWEIEPGYIARLQATGDNLRITEMEYDDASCTTDLTLGDPVLTMEQRLARLAKVS